jgi:hypothetical protein
MRGLSAKCQNQNFQICFSKEKSVDRADPIHRGLVAIAALGSSPELDLRPLRCPRALTMGRGRGRKNSFLNKNLIFEYTKALEICRRRFKRNFDMRIFPKIF